MWYRACSCSGATGSFIVGGCVLHRLCVCCALLAVCSLLAVCLTSTSLCGWQVQHTPVLLLYRLGPGVARVSPIWLPTSKGVGCELNCCDRKRVVQFLLSSCLEAECGLWGLGLLHNLYPWVSRLAVRSSCSRPFGLADSTVLMSSCSHRCAGALDTLTTAAW